MARRLSLATAVLAAVGIALAGYLTWVHYDASALVCRLGDCHTVQASQYAAVGPVPVALFGLVMYAVIFGCQIVSHLRPAAAFPATALGFAVALAGTIYAGYLTWLEVAVIRAVCQWCVASATLTAALLIVQSVMLWGAVGSGSEAAETDELPAAS